MKLKNYTSGVPIDRSVSNIERKLVEAGATRISKVYDGMKLTGVVFQIGNIVFKLPSRVDQVEKAMMSEIRKPRPGTADRIRDQAARTAWKILSEWAEIQVTLVRLQQAEAIEVFLPYVWDMKTDKTLFEKIKEGKFKMLSYEEPKNA